MGDVSCTRCPELMSTLTTGATSPDDCQCQAASKMGSFGGIGVGGGEFALGIC